MINFVSPPEWIHIEGVADGSSDQSGAEWQQVDFNFTKGSFRVYRLSDPPPRWYAFERIR
ncbi:hypothetical protein [Photorhabdus sp. RM96S]|uniref:hypothetical protein n=1 Tax=Photorhabdus sp. RM96S TaxID=3342822 RepID=UPI0036D8ED9D